MSPPILLTWEFGGGRGHVLKLGALARSLKERGFQPVFAVQRLDTLEAIRADCEGCDVFQAPLWPGFLSRAPAVAQEKRVTLGDSLGDTGFLQASTVEYVLRAWDRLFALIKPSVVVADFAPGSLLAARGRVPAVAYGNGYTLPPAKAERFAVLIDEYSTPKHDESLIVTAVNEALARCRRPAIDRLPAIFDADRSCVACYAELDPFYSWREKENEAPFLAGWSPVKQSQGDEIFAYLPEYITTYRTVIAALENIARTGTSIRLYVPNFDPTTAKMFADAGLAVESVPVRFDQIVTRSALLLTHGGLGTVSAALASGLPVAVVPLDLEKRLTGRALARLGVGRSLEIKGNNPLEASLLSAAIQEAYADVRLKEAARAAAPKFAARLSRPPGEAVADLVEELN